MSLAIYLCKKIIIVPISLYIYFVTVSAVSTVAFAYAA